MSLPLPSICMLAADPRERQKIGAFLEQAGLAIVAVANAPDALEALRAMRCSALVVALPEPACRDLLAALPRAETHVPIVMVLDRHSAPIEHPDVLTVRRPLRTQELISATLDQLLRVSDQGGRYDDCPAELALATAELACLRGRPTTALPSRRIAELQATLGID